MKTDFKFSNLLGTVYRKGNVIFTPDGTSLVSPVGSRVTVFDLINNKSHTLSLSHRRDIKCLALDPKGLILLTIDEDGRALLTNFRWRLPLYHFSFRGLVTAVTFSPSGRYIAVGLGRSIEIWHTPLTPQSISEQGLPFAPFVKHRQFTGHHETIQSIKWSSDSRYLLSAGRDSSVRIWSTEPTSSFVPSVLAGHREAVLAAWFLPGNELIYSVSQDGAMFQWLYASDQSINHNQTPSKEVEPSMRWRISDRKYFMQPNAKTRCVAYHDASKLLVAGFSNGIFGLYEMPGFQMLYSLSISQSNIDTVTFNRSGDWLAFGSSKFGQLLVWEWASESYVLKQQGHFDSLNSVTYSPDAHRIVSCADDGKIKLWDTQSGFCIATFTEHSGAVTACEYAKRGNILFTASLDGSLRAWDLIRYRNFRTFTAPSRLSFTSIAVDPSGEVVCAGSSDSFDVFTWSVQTGQFLDQLAGHEGPIASLAFAASGEFLVSGSWDHTIRIWNVFGRTQTSEPLQLQADITDVAIRPDSKQIAVSTLDGQITFWSVSEATQEAGMDGRRDISGGRKLGDRRTAANSSESKAFRCIVYSADGSCIFAGGESKYICLYDVRSGNLVQKITLSINLSLEGTQEYLNSRGLTEAGPAALLDDDDDAAADGEPRNSLILPGATRGDMSKRHTRPEIRVSALHCSLMGRAFCVASTEGLLIYSLDSAVQFDPLDLDADITPTSLSKAIDEKDYLQALVMAFRLNEKSLIDQVYERIPATNVKLVAKNVPKVYLAPLLRYVAQATEENAQVELNCCWLTALLGAHGSYLKDNAPSFSSELRSMLRAVSRMQLDLSKLTDYNTYALDYLLSQ